MLRIRAWEKWQGDAIYDRLRKRAPSGRSKPLTLAYIAVATNLDDQSGHFARFAEMLGCGIEARGFLVAILGHVGRDAAGSGVLRCSREQLGRILTDRLTEVSRKRGEEVYDALVASGIAQEVAPEAVREIAPPPSPEGSPPPSPEGSPPPGRRKAGAEERRGEEKERIPPVVPPGVPSGNGHGGGGPASPIPNGNGAHEVPPPPEVASRLAALGVQVVVGLDPDEIAGIDAACSALIGDRATPQDLRDEAKSVRKSLRAGDPPRVERVRTWVNETVFPREAARIAYLSGRKAAK